MSSLHSLHRQAAQHFDEHYKSKQRASQNTPFGSLGTELWEPNIYIWVLFSESSIKFLQVTKFFFNYSFTHTNIVFLFKHLMSSSKTFVTRWSVSVVIAFPFQNILISFNALIWGHSKILKYSEKCIWDHLSGTKVRN